MESKEIQFKIRIASELNICMFHVLFTYLTLSFSKLKGISFSCTQVKSCLGFPFDVSLSAAAETGKIKTTSLQNDDGIKCYTIILGIVITCGLIMIFEVD